jgi:hypothetical protein
MGGSPASSSKLPEEEQNGSERTPLLPRSERGSEESSVSRTKKAARWMVHNAVIVFMTLLIATVIIILCVFFGSRSRTTAPFSNALANPPELECNLSIEHLLTWGSLSIQATICPN